MTDPTAPPVLSPLLTMTDAQYAHDHSDAKDDLLTVLHRLIRAHRELDAQRTALAAERERAEQAETRLSEVVAELNERNAESRWQCDPDGERAHLTKRAERLERENERLREARADVVSWAPMLRYLRDAMTKGADNIDSALVAIEYDPNPNCPTCGEPSGGSFPTCAGCQLVEALKRGE